MQVKVRPMAADLKASKNSRLYFLGAMLLFWCVAICGRLVYLQVFSYGKFVKQAGHQQQRAIPLAAKRGVIFDRAGRELAMSVLVDSAFAVPTEVKDLPTAISLITHITGDDYNVVLADCRHHQTFCWVARKASDETIERINSLKLQGIHFQKEPKRFYPARDLAAQVLGSVGMEDSGQSGIEHEFDDELRGRDGKMFISVDARKQWFSDVETQPDPDEPPWSCQSVSCPRSQASSQTSQEFDRCNGRYQRTSTSRTTRSAHSCGRAANATVMARS